MDTITICDLEVQYHVGVPDEERAHAQRLLITLEMDLDLSQSAREDDLSLTINYYSVSQHLLQLGKGRSWKLIETLAEEIARDVLTRFGPDCIRVEVKKFIIPEARYVSVWMERSRNP